MTLKIVRVREKGKTRIRLSGELRIADLEDVGAEIARVAPPVTLDLEEVDLVDIHGIRWLNACQAQGVQVEHCAPYIREWMFQEKLDEGEIGDFNRPRTRSEQSASNRSVN